MEIKIEGLFNDIENAITAYLKAKNIPKPALWGIDINVFEMSIFIEKYIINVFKGKRPSEINANKILEVINGS